MARNLESGGGSDEIPPEEVAEMREKFLSEALEREVEAAKQDGREVYVDASEGVKKNMQKANLALTRRAENPELRRELQNTLASTVESLNNFAQLGDSEKPMSESKVRNLIAFLTEVTKAVNYTVGHGNRPADIKIDLSEWELNK
jgi:hypothetical protein